MIRSLIEQTVYVSSNEPREKFKRRETVPSLTSQGRTRNLRAPLLCIGSRSAIDFPRRGQRGRADHDHAVAVPRFLVVRPVRAGRKHDALFFEGNLKFEMRLDVLHHGSEAVRRLGENHIELLGEKSLPLAQGDNLFGRYLRFSHRHPPSHRRSVIGDRP
jgi:hypothetical protein